MAGIDTSSYGNPYWNSASSLFGSSGTSSTGFDYDAVVKSANDQYNSMKAKLEGKSTTSVADSSVAKMKKDAAAYLDSYTSAMTGILDAAGTLKNGGLDKILVNKDGEMTDDTIKAAGDAVKKLLDEYNDGVKLLRNNTDRGSGNVQQLDRMARNGPLADKSLEMLGITRAKDGTLSLDDAAFAEAFKTAQAREDNGAQMSFIKGLVGEVTDNIARDAQAGMNVSADKLISTNLAEINSSKASSNPYAEMYAQIRGNPMILNNYAALNLLNTWA